MVKIQGSSLRNVEKQIRVAESIADTWSSNFLKILEALAVKISEPDLKIMKCLTAVCIAIY
jgi:hypothetical protein